MNRFEERMLITQIGAGDHTQSSNQTGGQVRHNISVKILQQQNIELEGIEHELQTRVVDDEIAESNVGIVGRHPSCAIEEQPVCEFHDVGFVDCSDFFAPVGTREFEGKLGNSSGRFFR